MSVGSGRRPRVGSNPTTYSLKHCHLWLNKKCARVVIWALIWVPL
ncbi:hypothetical protein E2C01_092968 [Portunus trituberculatus]|uniref:Uncharacterized protein n=1 Tax=Portunus trituberculatus TaxID=210409 RepID=A0A5B7JZC3_PORTR|nr:hypothetical protein [Portunus trituberculatus]